MFRVTRVLLEVLVFQVWMDVTEPEEREEILAFLEKMDLMENRSEKLIAHTLNRNVSNRLLQN